METKRPRVFKYTFNKTKRPCDECGKKYTPNSPNQKYCKKCRVVVRKRQQTKNRRRTK